jgi:hypothetical protein
MIPGLLPAIAGLLEVPSTHLAAAGTFSQGRRRRIVLWAGVRARKILSRVEVSAAGTRGEK